MSNKKIKDYEKEIIKTIELFGGKDPKNFLIMGKTNYENKRKLAKTLHNEFRETECCNNTLQIINHCNLFLSAINNLISQY